MNESLRAEDAARQAADEERAAFLQRVERVAQDEAEALAEALNLSEDLEVVWGLGATPERREPPG